MREGMPAMTGFPSYNIAFDEEIGHFDYCTRVTVPAGTCNGGLEGAPATRKRPTPTTWPASPHPPPC